MEINEQNRTEGREAVDINLPAQSVVYLNETRKWTTFLSILGFIFTGFLVVLAIVFGVVPELMGPLGSLTPGWVFTCIYLVLAVIYFFPIYYLFKFSSWSKKALFSNEPNDLNNAFRYLKSHYRFMGILTIVLLGIYMLGFIIGMIAQAVM